MWLLRSAKQGSKNQMSQKCTFFSKVYNKLRILSLPTDFSCCPFQLHDLFWLQPRIESNFNVWNIGSSHRSQFNIGQMLLVNLCITVNSESFWDWHDNHWFKTSFIYMKNNPILTPSVSFWAWFPLLAAKAAANSSACLINIKRISNLYVNIRKNDQIYQPLALGDRINCSSWWH